MGRLGWEDGRGLADVGLEIGTRLTGVSRREVNEGAVAWPRSMQRKQTEEARRGAASVDAGRGGGWSSCSGDAAVQGTKEGADPGAVTEGSERESRVRARKLQHRRERGREQVRRG